jgi:hypothetical protein
MRVANSSRQSPGDNHDRPELSATAHLNESRGVADVATYPRHVKQFASGPLHGTALALYFVLLPYVVITKWGLSVHQSNAPLIRLLLVVLSIFWLTFLFQVIHNIVRLRQGHLIGRDGSAWLAGLVVLLLPFLVPTSSGAAATNSSSTLSMPYVAVPSTASWSLPPQHQPAQRDAARHGDPLGLVAVSPTSALSLALVAKRRKDSLRQHQYTLSESEIDDTVALLRSYDPHLIATLRTLIGDQREGVMSVPRDQLSTVALDNDEPLLVCVLGENDEGTVVSFASEGGQLLVSENWTSSDVIRGVVALHERGRVVFATTEAELLRALATRTLRSTLVLYLGQGGDLDGELRSCAITLGPFEPSAPLLSTLDPGDDHEATITAVEQYVELRAELLRSDPRITGLVEPFTASLRRRCIEMATYLALHRGEPVTGDRLRTRVLTNADVDASTRTLANTASAVRRSLGSDQLGPRLHAVTSSGLYVTHALTSDVEIFHGLVARARQLPAEEAAPLVHQALELVQGEPLASALRGFEWFLAEGHAARLARDGEWAALALHHQSIERGDYELAYWALEQGRLIDPYSDVLVTALAQVPRLREFGGNGSGRAQHETVGASGAEAMSWSFDRLRDQIA